MESTDQFRYRYKARIISVYDGDTVRADVDLGMGIWARNVKLRLKGINASELRSRSLTETRKAVKAREALEVKVLNKEVTIETHKDRTGKYGRYLATIWIEDDSRSERWKNVNDSMVQEGYAVPY